MMMFVLYYTNMLMWIFLVLWLKQQSTVQLDMPLYSATLSWFRANQSLLLLVRHATVLIHIILIPGQPVFVLTR